MPAVVNPGLGSLLSYSADGTTWSLLSQRVTLDGPSASMGTVETTNLDSTNKTFRGTIFDGGEMSGECQYDPAATDHVHMLVLLQAGTMTFWKLAFATLVAHTMVFQGILTQWQPGGMEVESNLSASFSIKVSGAFTVT